jgi:(5-formylfuran-3-yl)methyl phosphate synthase
MPGPHLLVSVRDATEAVAALAGGADLIDVKEPNRGPLGRADAATIAAVVQAVGGRVPISAAFGELRECPLVNIAADLPDGLQYVKWGLSGLSTKGWVNHLLEARLVTAHRRVVAVAYADWKQADAPRPVDIVAFAAESHTAANLFDTFQKNGSTLLDWMPIEEITALVRTCQEAGVRVALAGSLSATEIDRLRGVQPDWFAVRGAVCDGGRGGTISERRVRELADLVHSL